MCDSNTVRVFSEGPRWQGREALAKAQRSLGGENDSPSRNISRFLDSHAERHPEIGLGVMQVWRNDRFGRGGDHTELLNAGYPAVRFSVAVENYNQQHQDVRVEKGVTYGDTVEVMDFEYLAKVVKLNIAALAAIASAPPPPEPTVEGAVSTFTDVNWWGQSDMSPTYKVHWRRTDVNEWQQSREVSTKDGIVLWSHEPKAAADGRYAGTEKWGTRLKGIRVDDWVFGVSSVSKDGYESPVASAVPGGAFRPYVAPAEKK